MAVEKRIKKQVEKAYFERGSSIEEIASQYGYSTAIIRAIIHGEI